MTPDYLPIAVRAFAERIAVSEEQPPGRRRRRRERCWPSRVLVLDTETTIDAAQRLTFGSYRYYRVSPDGSLSCTEEGLVYADDLPTRDPDGFSVLQDYVRKHPAAVVPGVRSAIRLWSRQEFVQRVFYTAAYKSRALVVGFNLLFDLARIAMGWGEARGTFAGGISLWLAGYRDDAGAWRENRYRPRIAFKTIDNKRALKGFTRPVTIDDAEQIPEGADDGQPDPAYTFRGHFLDLRTLAFVLTNQGHSLESACRAFGVEHGKLKVKEHGIITTAYVDYNRRDVQATAELLEQLRAEYDRHPIALQATRAYSPATMGKEYPRAMGIRPILERQPDFSREMIGRAMIAFYGGRAECHIRHVPVPIVYCDFLSMYPTVNALMGLWDFLTAERIEVVDDTEAVQRLLDHVTLQDCFNPTFWRELPAIIQIEPAGDVVPVRAQYGAGPDWQIGVNPLHADEPLWYSLADLVASKLLTGRAPRVRRAWRLVPVGRQAGLQPVRLRGAVEVDPTRQDFFRTVIEERKRLPDGQKHLDLFLKVLAISAVYGIYAEMVRQELPRGQQANVRVYGLDTTPFTTKVSAPEEPGEFCFPPLAACITGAARLMLGMLERCVTDAGGTYAFCDTDSMGIVAMEQGGLVPCPGGRYCLPDGGDAIQALSWATVEAIRERFAALNPYDRSVVPGSILKIEDENYVPCGLLGHDRDEHQQPKICVCTKVRWQLYCYSISAKRYCLYNLNATGQPTLRKVSEHGLGGVYLDPTDPQELTDPSASDATEENADGEDADPSAAIEIGKARRWVVEGWEWLLRSALGLPAPELAWLDRPAISRITASTPQTLRAFRAYNDGRSYAEQVKPGNFLLSAHVAPFGHPDGVDPERFHLVAPYQTDPRQWRKMTWTDLYSRRGYKISTTATAGSAGVARVKTYRDVLEEYRTHPESKALGPDRLPGRRTTRGLLQRRSISTRADLLVYIGKEGNRLQDRQQGLVHHQGAVLNEYRDPRRRVWETLIEPILRQMPKQELARSAGLHPRSIAALRNGHARPRPSTQSILARAAATFARTQLTVRVDDDIAACVAYLGRSQPAPGDQDR